MDAIAQAAAKGSAAKAIRSGADDRAVEARIARGGRAGAKPAGKRKRLS